MKQDQEQRVHVCKFCKQTFSNGKKLGGHMRGHLALISASRNKGTRENDQESINGEKGFDVFGDDHQVIKKVQGVDQDFYANGRKQGVQGHDQEFINGRKGLDEDGDQLIKTSQQRMDLDHEYDDNGRKQGIQEHDQEFINGEKGLDFDEDDDEKKGQQEVDFDQDYGANVYVLRENPKKSWRVSNSSSSKAIASHKSSHSRKESIKNSECDKCGKVFDSVKALHGHMRCHSLKRSQSFDESSALSSSEEHDDDDGVANPVRKKRSCTRYKSPKPKHISTSLSSSNDDEAVKGAINLMMFSRGVRDLDEVKLVVPRRYSRIVENFVEDEVSDDGSMESYKFKNKSELGLKKDLICDGSGSGQLNMGRVGSTLGWCKSTKKPRSTEQDLTDTENSIELKRKSKDYKCAICFKRYVSIQGLARHERVHNKTERNDDVHSDVDLNREGSINKEDVGTKKSLLVSYCVLKQ